MCAHDVHVWLTIIRLASAQALAPIKLREVVGLAWRGALEQLVTLAIQTNTYPDGALTWTNPVEPVPHCNLAISLGLRLVLRRLRLLDAVQGAPVTVGRIRPCGLIRLGRTNAHNARGCAYLPHSQIW